MNEQEESEMEEESGFSEYDSSELIDVERDLREMKEYYNGMRMLYAFLGKPSHRYDPQPYEISIRNGWRPVIGSSTDSLRQAWKKMRV